MNRYELYTNDQVDHLAPAVYLEAIEQAASEFELRTAQKTTLRTYKGSVHYHFKREDSPGVLEVTYWPQKQKLWVDIHTNRQGSWNLAMAEPFCARLAQLIGGGVDSTGLP